MGCIPKIGKRMVTGWTIADAYPELAARSAEDPLAAMRLCCLECMGPLHPGPDWTGTPEERIERCEARHCPLWGWRDRASGRKTS